ncbi:hypothetical protein E1181_20935 [Saccharopolyspora terrae]|uniref:DUF3592 domain-containing protein n=1 Tax=Saccharopolyspora terrae TaxID=2530384 RepID=A0A4R4VLI9_9PSEU|nr:DUF6346 domain-containing protein [Saccharopolyspora terrae]TDD03204.1 hypothetical protein E1181_20935 [Saccharopolyspora terrae]
MSKSEERKRAPVRIVGGVVLLLAALLHYGYFLADRDQGGPVEAQGEVLACSPEWVYLGLLSSCEVRTPDGVLSVSAARVDEAVPGQRVDLSYSDARGSVHDGWRVAQPAPNYGLAVPAEVLLVGLSAWSLYRGVRPGRGRGELDGFERYLVGFSLGMAVVFGYGAFLLHGWFVSGSQLEVEPTGTAVARSCERDVSMLGTTWQCAAEVTINETGQRIRHTFGGSQLSPADVGKPVPVGFDDPGNAAGPTVPWATIGTWPGSAGYGFAVVGIVLLCVLSAGCALGAWQTWRKTPDESNEARADSTPAT